MPGGAMAGVPIQLPNGQTAAYGMQGMPGMPMMIPQGYVMVPMQGERVVICLGIDSNTRDQN